MLVRIANQCGQLNGVVQVGNGGFFTGVKRRYRSTFIINRKMQAGRSSSAPGGPPSVHIFHSRGANLGGGFAFIIRQRGCRGKMRGSTEGTPVDLDIF